MPEAPTRIAAMARMAQDRTPSDGVERRTDERGSDPSPTAVKAAETPTARGSAAAGVRVRRSESPCVSRRAAPTPAMSARR